MGAIAGRGIRKGERGFICYDSAMAFPERVGEEKDLSALPCFFFCRARIEREYTAYLSMKQGARFNPYYFFFFFFFSLFISSRWDREGKERKGGGRYGSYYIH